MSSNFTKEHNTATRAQAVTGMKQSFTSVTRVTCLMGKSASGACYAASTGGNTVRMYKVLYFLK